MDGHVNLSTSPSSVDLQNAFATASPLAAISWHSGSASEPDFNWHAGSVVDVDVVDDVVEQIGLPLTAPPVSSSQKSHCCVIKHLPSGNHVHASQNCLASLQTA